MISYISHVMTLANSIIGVSVLAMPFCFKQCGIILSVLVLTLCSLLSRIACHFLIKSAVMSRRRNYEFLAFHAFGPMGKILVELLIIGFLIGTCIAFFVVIGDLGPQIIGKLLNKNFEDIKLSFLLTTASLIVLPLGLLRNIGSLASICTVAIGFYLCLVLKVIAESMGHIFSGDWYEHVNYWRPAGILQCLPIFSMALFCQTQLFEIYESIPNVSLEKMNVVVKGAINICTLVYISVGFFGYVGFCTQSFSGNILMSFEPSLSSDAIKIGFVLSVIASFPLVIFPCRASLNSLLFRRVYLHDTAANYIPEIRFRCLTFTIITVSLITGLSMPNIEFVLGLVGSTIGVLICLIFPAAFFIAISTKNTNERLIAQGMLFIGMWIMILGTYASIYSVEESSTTKIVILTDKSILQMNNIQLNPNMEVQEIIPGALPRPIQEKDELSPSRIILPKSLDPDKFIDPGKVGNKIGGIITKNNLTLNPSEIKNVLGQNFLDKNPNNEMYTSVILQTKNAKHQFTAEEKMRAIEEKKGNIEQPLNDNVIHSDAIEKEDSEIAAAADQSVDVEAVERLKSKQQIQDTLQDTLEQHKIETMKLMEEQKAILQHIKEQKKEFEMDEEIMKNLKSKIEKKHIAQPIVEVAGKKDDGIIRNAVGEDQEKPDNVQPKEDKIPSLKLLEKDQVIPQNNKEKKTEYIVDKKLLENIRASKETENVVRPILDTGGETKERIFDNIVKVPKESLKNQSIDNKKRESLELSLNNRLNSMENETPLKIVEAQEKLVVKNSVNHEAAGPNQTNDGEMKVVNVSIESRGPVLRALTNKTLNQLVESNLLSIKEDFKKKERYNDSDNMQYAIPIALKLINQTKDSVAQEADINESVKQPVHRDILESHVREKRDVNDTTTVGTNDSGSMNIKDHKEGNQECAKNETSVTSDNSNNLKNIINAETTTEILIKTFTSLTDEKFIDNISKLNPTSISNINGYQVVKKRDLKSLRPENSQIVNL